MNAEEETVTQYFCNWSKHWADDSEFEENALTGKPFKACNECRNKMKLNKRKQQIKKEPEIKIIKEERSFAKANSNSKEFELSPKKNSSSCGEPKIIKEEPKIIKEDQQIIKEDQQIIKEEPEIKIIKEDPKIIKEKQKIIDPTPEKNAVDIESLFEHQISKNSKIKNQKLESIKHADHSSVPLLISFLGLAVYGSNLTNDNTCATHAVFDYNNVNMFNYCNQF